MEGGKKRHRAWSNLTGREGRSVKPVITEVVLLTVVAPITWAKRAVSGMASSLRGGILHFSGFGVSHAGKPRWDRHLTSAYGLVRHGGAGAHHALLVAAPTAPLSVRAEAALPKHWVVMP